MVYSRDYFNLGLLLETVRESPRVTVVTYLPVYLKRVSGEKIKRFSDKVRLSTVLYDGPPLGTGRWVL